MTFQLHTEKMADSNYKRPKVLLLGNGLLRSFGNTVSWKDMLKEMHCNPHIDKDFCFDGISFPLEVVLRTNDGVDTAIAKPGDKNKTAFDNREVTPELGMRLQELLKGDFDHILTTNYGYEIEAVAAGKTTISDRKLMKHQKHTDRVKIAETTYLLHTYYDIANTKIWHIHGEGRKKNSIVLGHYYYGNLLARYKEYFAGIRNKYRQMEDVGETPPIKSWLDAFILGDVYILGLGMDFSEIDLWWLINRKKRENASFGKIYFLEPRQGKDVDLKRELLRCYDVELRDYGVELDSPKTDDEDEVRRVEEINKEKYRMFYDTAIAHLRNCQ